MVHISRLLVAHLQVEARVGGRVGVPIAVSTPTHV